MPSDPTAYPDVNAVLRLLLPGLQDVLRDLFVGLYLHGSLALGDFDPRRSDIDFLIATTTDLADEALSALGKMHARIAASSLPLAARLEGPCIPLQALQRHDPARACHPWLGSDGHFALDAGQRLDHPAPRPPRARRSGGRTGPGDVDRRGPTGRPAAGRPGYA